MKNSEKMSYGEKQLAFAIALLLCLCALLVFTNRDLQSKYENVNKKFVSEVPLTIVPVQGTKSFTASIHMRYVDGELKEVTLVPRTTVEEK